MNILLVGGSGTAGRSILAGLDKGLSVLTVSRTKPVDILAANVRWKFIDLDKPETISTCLCDEPVDILIYAAAGQPILSKYKPFDVAALRRLGQRIARKNHHDESDFLKAAMMTQTFDPDRHNLQIFKNLIEALQQRDGPPIQHIILLTGGMSYGVQTGPIFNLDWTGVLTEDSPRQPGPNWYYDMEDYAQLLRKSYCPVTLLRPSYILYEGGFVRQNLAHSIGLYLESQRQLGGKAVFPGGAENYHRSWSFTPSSLIGRQVDWIIHNPPVWGEVFNSVAQQPIKWSELWPRLAEAYGLEIEVPKLPLSLGRRVRDHLDGYWLLERHGYDPDYFTPLDFIDIAMVCYWDMVYSMDKATALGFNAHSDIFRPFVQEQQRMNEWMDHNAAQHSIKEAGTGW